MDTGSASAKMEVWREGEEDPGGRKVGSTRKNRQGASETQFTDPMNCTWTTILTKFFRIKPFYFYPTFL